MTLGYGKSMKHKIISYADKEKLVQIPANQELIVAVLNLSAFLMILNVKLIHFKIVIITGMIHLLVTIHLSLMILVLQLLLYLKQ
jgi:hypothetical protein